MVEHAKTGSASAGTMTQAEKMQAGRRASSAKRQDTSDLGVAAKYALRVLANARSGAKVVQDQIKAGRMPDAAVIEAASVLAGAAASAMLE